MGGANISSIGGICFPAACAIVALAAVSCSATVLGPFCWVVKSIDPLVAPEFLSRGFKTPLPVEGPISTCGVDDGDCKVAVLAIQRVILQLCGQMSNRVSAQERSRTSIPCGTGS